MLAEFSVAAKRQGEDLGTELLVVSG